jgi:hypothetical protein
MKGKIVAATIFITAFAQCAAGQLRISADGWEGFPVRKPNGTFDRCVLYDRTIDALNASPYDMLGVTRDQAGHVGLQVFYGPRVLTRGLQVPVAIKIDDAPPFTASGDVVSDFHVRVVGPLEAAAIEKLRVVGTLEVTTQGRTLRFELGGLAGVLDALADCVTANARR